MYAAELSMSTLLKESTGTKKFSPLPRYPVVQRDLAVVVDRDVENAALTELILRADTPVIIENVNLFDVYSGAGVLLGKKSMAYTFTLRAEDHTLCDEEIRSAMDAIIRSLELGGAPLRS
ncbi:phenylalanine--tRNA ligase beta subunit [Clostridium sp. CAG:1024]|nr:phenylalanine--tRNA ligase beta subunit [Clostridium sp. CAG:1024]